MNVKEHQLAPNVPKDFVIFGGSPLPATIALSATLSTTKPGVGGFSILGQAAYDQSGGGKGDS